MLLEVKIKTQYTNTKEFNKEGPLNIGKLVLAFEATTHFMFYKQRL